MATAHGGRRLAKGLALVAGAGVIVVPLAETLGWGLIARAVQAARAEPAGGAFSHMFSMAATGWSLPGVDPAQVATPALVAGWLLSMAGTIPLLVGLWSVRRTFLESAEGRPFSEASVKSFRRFAWASFAVVIVAIVERTAVGLAVSTLSPDIQDTLGVGVSSEDVAKLFGAMLFVAVAHMFAEGRRLNEEVEALL